MSFAPIKQLNLCVLHAMFDVVCKTSCQVFCVMHQLTHRWRGVPRAPDEERIPRAAGSHTPPL